MKWSKDEIHWRADAKIGHYTIYRNASGRFTLMKLGVALGDYKTVNGAKAEAVRREKKCG